MRIKVFLKFLSFQQALEIEPDNMKALFRKGTAQFHLHNYLDAEKDFMKVLQVDPKGTNTTQKIFICR